MTSRPAVSVYDPATLKTTETRIPLPAVLTAPIRLDIVQFVHANINKNRRQAHGVNVMAGKKHSAESWGTGRAVARIPRVGGSGTHRSGQAAFGNMCRKGRMFAPLKTWRRWHRRVNIKQKRHAVASALAASAIVPLVLARGHRIAQVPQLPLVFEDKLENYEKTKQAVELLKRAGAYDDVKKVVETRKIKAGKGKLRNKRYQERKGPLFIYSNENVKLVKAVRNIPGVEIANVNRLNLLQLAPGGHIGRFIIWTASAFRSLDKIFGTYRYGSIQKQDYNLNRSMVSNPDLARIINSNQVQSVVRPAKQTVTTHSQQRRNPLTNIATLEKLNPNAPLVKATARKSQEAATQRRQQALKEKRSVLSKDQKKALTQQKKLSNKWISLFKQNISAANQAGIEEELKLKEVYQIEE